MSIMKKLFQGKEPNNSAEGTLVRFDNGSFIRLVPAEEEKKRQDAESLIKEGDSYQDLHQYEKAIDVYNRVLQSYPNHFGVYLNRGNAYLELGRYDEAINDYKKSITIHPNFYLGYANLAHVYKKTGQRKLELKTYETLLACLPKDQNESPYIKSLKERIKELKSLKL